MILKELRINNFRSYYKESIFTFKDGLTLIIGGNGDGKTTFFDALDWLFITGTENKSTSLISEKRKSEMMEGDIDIVSVSLDFEHDGLKSIEKRFSFEKTQKGTVVIRDYSFQGWDGIGSERMLVKGDRLLDQCFDVVIRKYCLFKGESNLNVFDNKTAIKTLVEEFSNIRQFDNYVNLSTKFEEKSDIAHKKELRNDGKVSKKAKVLETELINLNRSISDVKNDIAQQEIANNVFQTKIEDLERHQDMGEKLNEIKSRIKTLSEKIYKLKAHIDENYNIKLLDDKWILILFPDIFNEFQKKVAALGKEKRKLYKEFIEKRAADKERKRTVEELTAIANGAVPLSNFVPDGETMQEMIDDHVCKVCNRIAEEGSAAHNFMKEKLAQYMRSIEAKNREEQKELNAVLFPQSHIEELHNISISLGGSRTHEITELREIIKDKIELNARLKEDVVKTEEQLQEANDEKNRLLMQASGASEDVLEAKFNDIKGFFDQKNRSEMRLIKLNDELNILLARKKEINNEYCNLNPESGLAKIYSRVHTAFQKILIAFENAKMANLRKFLADIEERANYYLELLNIDDFHGIVRIVETANDSARIQLYSSNGTKIDDPNGALKTTMYMSVLFAISDLTTRKREIDYPLIFDAPTSSFESFKEDEFYNVIDKINKQCIIVTKDLLDKDETTGTRILNNAKIESLTCSVYRIEKQRPFDQNDLSTICTTSTPIK